MEKRKSNSIFGRRRSRSIGTFMLSGLCETIPDSLLPHSRLQMLIEYALKQSLSIVEREFGLSGSLNPNSETELWQKVEDALQEQMLCESAVYKKEKEDNSVINEKIDECDRYTEKFEEEKRKWDALELHYRDALNCAVDSNTVSFSNSVDFSKYKLNYFSVLEDMHCLADNLNFQVHGFLETIGILNSCLEMGSVFISEMNSEAEKLLTKQDLETPRTVIRKVLFSDVINEANKP